MKFAAAPLGRDVKIVTLIGSVVIGGPLVAQAWSGFWLVPVLFGTILAIVALLCVRGYELASGELRVNRLLWDTHVALGANAKAFVRPNAMQGSWRLWGNEGMLAVHGRFSGSGLGRYRAFVTDPARTVVVDTGAGIVVVSPDRPEDFAAAIAGGPARTAA